VCVVTGPVSNIWLDPDSGFSPGKVVTCKANGNPRPRFHWIRMTDNATRRVGAKLDVKSANHSYICRATNTVRGRTYTVMSTEVNFNAATGMWQCVLCAIGSHISFIRLYFTVILVSGLHNVIH